MSDPLEYNPTSVTSATDSQVTTTVENTSQTSWNTVSHGQMQINDVLLDIPPQNIQISNHVDNLELPLLRNKNNATIKSGHGDLYLSISLVFKDHTAINNQLFPLLQQFRKTPFCVVENELVRKAVSPETYDNTKGCRKDGADNIVFALVNGTVSTMDAMPGLTLDLNLMLFNYKPFSDDFSFKRDWKTSINSSNIATDSTAMVSQYESDATQVTNPKDSAVWQVFWQYKRLGTLLSSSGLSNSLKFEFTMYSGESDSTATWTASKMIPLQVAVNYSNRVAKQPVLNWVYATHQFIGGMNRTVQITTLCSDKDRTELEKLQYYFQKNLESACKFRKKAKQQGVKITNDVVNLCGINEVALEDFNIDTVPGHPDLIQCTLLLKEFYLPQEEASSYDVTSEKGVYQKALMRLLDIGQQLGIVQMSADGKSWTLDKGFKSLSTEDQIVYDSLKQLLSESVSSSSNTGITVNDIAPGFGLSDDTGYGVSPSVSLATGVTGAADNVASQLKSGAMTATCCGDAVDKIVNGGITAGGGTVYLPTGTGLGKGELISAANAYGVPVLQRNQLSLANLQASGAGTVLWYKRTPQDEYYSKGTTHAEIILINPATNTLGVYSYSAGTTGYWKALDESYASKIPQDAIAANILSSSQLGGSAVGTYPSNGNYTGSAKPVTQNASIVSPERLYQLADKLLSGPLSKDSRFSELANTLAVAKGNMPQGVCYPDLDLPPHPATGRMLDTEPDFYLYNVSDQSKYSMQEKIEDSIAVIQQAFADIQKVKGSSGLGWENAVSDIPLPTATASASANKPTASTSSTSAAKTSASTPTQITHSEDLDRLIQQYAEKYALARGLDAQDLAALTKGLINQESSWVMQWTGGSQQLLDAYSPGWRGQTSQADLQAQEQVIRTYMSSWNASHKAKATTAYGYGQFLAGTAAGMKDTNGNSFTAADRFNPDKNLEMTVDYLSSLLKSSSGNVAAAVRNYTGGSGGSQHVNNIINATQQYRGGKAIPNTAVARTPASTTKPIVTQAAAATTGTNTSSNRKIVWHSPPDSPTNNGNKDSVNFDDQNTAVLKQNVNNKPYEQQASSGNFPLTGALKPSSITFNDQLGPTGAATVAKAFMQGYKEDTLTMRRAYPTFALYFIDEFMGDIISVITSSYRYDAVKEIRLVRSRKNPIDTLVVELSNTQGTILNEQFVSLTGSEKYADTTFNKQLIKEGTIVQLRLGYSNNPENLETVFNGKITEIEGSLSAILTLVCQSYAIEMFQSEKGEDPTAKIGWFNSDTREIIDILLCDQDLKHFGRWQPQHRGARDIVQSGEGGGYHGSLWRYFFRFFPNPSDNNIYAPEKTVLQNFLQIWQHIWNTASVSGKSLGHQWIQYVPYRQTIWEIIDEMTLRHPGYIASVVPYGNRSTLFFGVPHQMYFSRPPSNNEMTDMNKLNANTSTIVRTDSWLRSMYGTAYEAVKSSLGMIAGTSLVSGVSNILGVSSSSKTYDSQLQTYLNARMKPYREYHWLDSEHHIIGNNMITTAKDTFNSVAVEYVLDAKQAYNTSSGNLPNPSNFYTHDTLKVKADDDIREDFCRWFHTRERNCEGDYFAECYAISYLYRFLKDLYQGEITIIGNPKIKPYDVVWIYDSYNDMCGPIEVEQVTHIFSSETGFVTVITPDLVVTTNEYASASVTDAIGMWFMHHYYASNTKNLFGNGFPNSVTIDQALWDGSMSNSTSMQVSEDPSFYSDPDYVSPAVNDTSGAALGAITAAYLFTPWSILITGGFGIMIWNWARQRQPIRVSPVLWRGRPFLVGLDGFTLDNVWAHCKGKIVEASGGINNLLQYGLDFWKTEIVQTSPRK